MEKIFSMRHPAFKWLAMAFAIIGGFSSAFWVLFDKSNQSTMTALHDGLFLDYQIGDDDEFHCRLTFKQQPDDTFQIIIDGVGICPVAPFSMRSGNAIRTVDIRAKPVGDSDGLVVWGSSDRIWLPPDRQEIVKGVPHGFGVTSHTSWGGFQVAVVDVTVGGLNRQFFFDRKTGFLVGMKETGVDHQHVPYKLLETNATAQ